MMINSEFTNSANLTSNNIFTMRAIQPKSFYLPFIIIVPKQIPEKKRKKDINFNFELEMYSTA